MSSHQSPSTLEEALSRAGGVPYEELCLALQQQYTLPEYRSRCVVHAIAHGRGYEALPAFVRVAVTERRFAELIVTVSLERMQVFPYRHAQLLSRFTKESPLTYYVQMVSNLLKSEKSYDALPNFTALDILNLLGIGRNQFLSITREVRSSVWWRVTRMTPLIRDALPKELISSASVDPMAQLWLVDGGNGNGNGTTASSPPPSGGASDDAESSAGSPVRARKLLQRSASPLFAFQLHKDAVHALYRRGHVIPSTRLCPADCLLIPPMETFVMNRSSDDPLESMLYQILATVDEHTSIDCLAQLLSQDVDLVVSGCELLVHLGLARRTGTHSGCCCVPAPAAELLSTCLIAEEARSIAEWKVVRYPMKSPSAHYAPSTAPEAAKVLCDVGSWGDAVVDILDRKLRQCYPPSSEVHGADASSSTDVHHDRDSAGLSHDAASIDESGGHGGSGKGMTLLYDAGITGTLMMTNLSTDPSFKRAAVTLFEAGKLSDDSLESFEAKLLRLQDTIVEDMDGGGWATSSDPQQSLGLGSLQSSNDMRGDESASSSFGGEASSYLSSAVCLGKVLHLLRSAPLGDDVRNAIGRTVEMRKVEALNELEATTRYLILARKYVSYFGLYPLCSAPLLDLALDSVYSTTVALLPSPWMLLAVYRSALVGCGCTPPSVFIPFGERLSHMPRVLQPLSGCSTVIRMQTTATDAEVTFFSPHNGLMMLNATLRSTPVFCQRVADLPRERTSQSTSSEPTLWVAEVHIPFTVRDDELMEVLERQLKGKALRSCATQRRQCARKDVSGPATVQLQLRLSEASQSIRHQFRSVIDTFGLEHSIGFLGFCITIEDRVTLQDAATNSSGCSTAAECWDVQLTETHACLVELGFGFPISKRNCCDVIVDHVPTRVLGSLDHMSAHNAAVKRLSDVTLALMDEIQSSSLPSSTSDAELIRRLAIDAAEDPSKRLHLRGPSNQRHLRSLGCRSHFGNPFPEVQIVVDADGQLTWHDEWDPLSQ